MDQVTKVKPADVAYEQHKLDKLLEQTLLAWNLTNLIKDFETVYIEFMNQGYQLSEGQVAQLKTDLLMAFCYGAVTSCDINTNFRMGYKTPEKKATILGIDGQPINQVKQLIL